MTVEIIISSAVVSAIITVIGNIISAKMARRTAKEAANKEIEKLELTWQREDLVSSDDEFAGMAAACARFINSNTGISKRDALEKVAAVRSKECGDIAVYLDKLYQSILSGNQSQANSHLTDAINEKRSLKQKSSR